LHNDYSIALEAAKWTVYCWATSLGKMNETNMKSILKNEPIIDKGDQIKEHKDSLPSSSQHITLVWSAKIGIDVYSFGHPPKLSQDEAILYVGSRNKYLYALDIKSGGIFWSFMSDDRIDASPEISADNTIVYFASTSTIYALDTNEGKLIWKVGIGGHSFSSPRLSPDGQTLYVGGTDKSLYSIHTYNGKRK
jgi:outer membrane protein assembly factor BamB